MYFRENDTQFQRISSSDLRAALDDPRLPESFDVEVASNYPALVIRTNETDPEDPEGYWYIGYIDLFDAEFHPRRRGERDGINPIDREVVMVRDPELPGWNNGRSEFPPRQMVGARVIKDMTDAELNAAVEAIESRKAKV